MAVFYTISVSFRNKDWRVHKIIHELNCFYEYLLNLEKKIPHSGPDTISSFIAKLRSNTNDEELSLFIRFLSQIPEVASSPVFLEFIEFSWFSDTQRIKCKESYVSVPFEEDPSCCSSCLCCCMCCSHPSGNKKWLILSEESIGFTDSFTGREFRYMLLLKDVEKIYRTEAETGFDDGIELLTSQVKFTFLAGSVDKKNEWFTAMTHMLTSAAWNQGTKLYGSSFQERPNNDLKWFINAQDYYREVYAGLMTATEEVFISDWWFCPELFLIRPSTANPQSQVIKILKVLAEKGVKVYVLMYHEFITHKKSMNSEHNEKVLKSLGNPNIKVLRHPNDSLFKGTFLWTHHEKTIIIDQSLAFFGGIDVCFGRFDTSHHSLVDNQKPYLWNGIDFHNSRIKGFENVVSFQDDELNRNTEVRMPWHDASLCVRGEAARDIGLHFIEYWNFVIVDEGGPEQTQKTFIQSDVQEADSINPPLNREESKRTSQHPEAETTSAVLLHKGMHEHAQRLFVAAGLKLKTHLSNEPKQVNQLLRSALLRPRMSVPVPEDYNCVCEVVRSASDWSLGLKRYESSIHLAYLTLIEQSQYCIYIENQFFISSTAGDPIVNRIAQALVDRIIRAFEERQKFMVYILLPLLPDQPGNVWDCSSVNLRLIMSWEYRTISRGESSMFAQLLRAGLNPDDYIRFYSLRTHEVLNGNPVTEQIYIHCKIMIVDDDVAIVGSANINDRSLTGTRDSEIAMVIRDTVKVNSAMDGRPWTCGKFTLALRMALFKEFLADDRIDVGDPICDKMMRTLEDTARTNTEMFREIFGCYPDDTFTTYRSAEEKFIDMKSKEAITMRQANYERLNGNIKGLLVEFPHKFLVSEELQGTAFSIEKLMPTIVVT